MHGLFLRLKPSDFPHEHVLPVPREGEGLLFAGAFQRTDGRQQSARTGDGLSRRTAQPPRKSDHDRQWAAKMRDKVVAIVQLQR